MSREEAFIKIIKDHEGIIYKIARIYADNTEEQADLYQEIVFQMWKSFDSFRGEAKISTWMYRIALNTALFHSKQKNKRGRNVSLDKIVLKQENYDTVMEDRLKILYQQIRRLNDLEKAVILLFLEGRTHEEISAITGLSHKNVGTRISRIKDKLIKTIKK